MTIHEVAPTSTFKDLLRAAYIRGNFVTDFIWDHNNWLTKREPLQFLHFDPTITHQSSSTLSLQSRLLVNKYPIVRVCHPWRMNHVFISTSTKVNLTSQCHSPGHIVTVLVNVEHYIVNIRDTGLQSRSRAHMNNLFLRHLYIYTNLSYINIFLVQVIQ